MAAIFQAARVWLQVWKAIQPELLGSRANNLTGIDPWKPDFSKEFGPLSDDAFKASLTETAMTSDHLTATMAAAAHFGASKGAFEALLVETAVTSG